jgi:hypothetical protein
VADELLQGWGLGPLASGSAQVVVHDLFQEGNERVRKSEKEKEKRLVLSSLRIFSLDPFYFFPHTLPLLLLSSKKKKKRKGEGMG